MHTLNFLHRCLKQTYRNTERMSVILFLPIIFTIGIAWIYGDESSFVIVDDQGETYNIGIINFDSPPILDPVLENIFRDYIVNLNSTYLQDSLEEGFGCSLIEGLESNSFYLSNDNRRFAVFRLNSSVEEATKAVQSRFISLCVILPKNFSQTVLTGLVHRINLTTGIINTNISDYYFSRSNIEFIGDYTYARFSEAWILFEVMVQKFLDQFWITGMDVSEKFVIHSENVSTLAFTEFDIFTPALLIFILISSSTGVSAIVGFEQEHGTINRLKISGSSPRSYFLGLTLTQILSTLVTMGIILATLVLLGFPFQHLNQIFWVLLICCIAILPLLGISLSTATLSDGQLATYIPSLIGIPLAFLTGNFIPLTRTAIVGDIQLWHINPFYSVGEAFRKILILNADFSLIIIDIVMLILVGSLICFIGGYIFLKKAYS